MSSPIIIPFITNMLTLLNILCEDHQFTAEILIKKILPQTYRQTVRRLLDSMMLKELVFQQIENEDLGEDLYSANNSHSANNPYEPNINIVATYDIGADYQIVIVFDEDSKLMGIDIGFDIPGLDKYETNLYNRDAVLHALFLYAWNTFTNVHNLAHNNMCLVPECIYFKDYGKQFCCEECVESQIRPKCILLREQGRKCSCKMCKVIKLLL